MCGIGGIIGLKDREKLEISINRMTLQMAHRGPDATGLLIDGATALTHLRLSIIDLSETANQPMADDSNRYIIIFNGEIYNYRKVKTLFPEYPFRTNSDTEVILAAYKTLGADCLRLFNGMFALAIWDRHTGELFMARDRLGVKPLYFSEPQNGQIVFASEIRAILSTGLIDKKIDRTALYNYLMFQGVYEPHTIVENIKQLPAGHFAKYKDGKLSVEPFWQIEDAWQEKLDEDSAKIRQTLKNKLLTAVEGRLVSDVRLGAFLSGGIDSSAVVALMAEISDQPVETFSINFSEKKFDESVFSTLVSKKFNTRHTAIRLNARDFLESLPEALLANDSPSGDGLNTYLVSKATKKAGLTVALSGLGGDELFAGYPNFLNWLKLKNGRLATAPRFVRSAIGQILQHSKKSKFQRLGGLLSESELSVSNVYTATRQVLSPFQVSELMPSERHNITILSELNNKLSKIERFPLLSQFSIAEILGYTKNILLKDTDQYSMASALEVREPFFDYELIEFVLRIPDRLKYPKYPKSLLVESLYPLLPDEIVHRPKMGFVFPFEKWMRHELRGFCEDRIDLLAERELVSPLALKQKWADFLKGKNGVLWSHLWHLIVLTEWLENNKF